MTRNMRKFWVACLTTALTVQLMLPGTLAYAVTMRCTGAVAPCATSVVPAGDAAAAAANFATMPCCRSMGDHCPMKSAHQAVSHSVSLADRTRSARNSTVASRMLSSRCTISVIPVQSSVRSTSVTPTRWMFAAGPAVSPLTHAIYSITAPISIRLDFRIVSTGVRYTTAHSLRAPPIS